MRVHSIKAISNLFSSGENLDLEMERVFGHSVGGAFDEQSGAQATEDARVLRQVGGYVVLALRLDNGVATGRFSPAYVQVGNSFELQQRYLHHFFTRVQSRYTRYTLLIV